MSKNLGSPVHLQLARAEGKLGPLEALLGLILSCSKDTRWSSNWQSPWKPGCPLALISMTLEATLSPPSASPFDAVHLFTFPWFLWQPFGPTHLLVARRTHKKLGTWLRQHHLITNFMLLKVHFFSYNFCLDLIYPHFRILL